MTGVDPKRVLIAEGNDLNRQILEDHLVFCGYEILSLPNGSSFFQALTDFQPDLILFDLRLPDVDGYTILENLQAEIEWQNIPVIVVAASAFKADQQRLLNLKVRQFFVSPVPFTALIQAIQSQLSD